MENFRLDEFRSGHDVRRVEPVLKTSINKDRQKETRERYEELKKQIELAKAIQKQVNESEGKGTKFDKKI